MSDHKGARLVLGALLVGSTLIADRGYDSNWFREVPAEGDIKPWVPPPQKRKVPIAYDMTLYPQHPSCDPLRPLRSHLFSAICIAASVAFYLN